MNGELSELLKSEFSGLMDDGQLDNPALRLVQLIASNADLGIIVLNKNLEIIFFNDYYSKFSENIYNIRPHSKMTVHQLFPEDIRDDLVDKLNQSVNGAHLDFMSIHKFRDKKYFYKRICTPILNNKNEVLGVLALIYDLSELYRSQEDLEHLNKELDKRVRERTEQLEKEIHTRKAIETELKIAKEQISVTLHREKELSTLKSKLLDNIAHEINTPLTIISSSAFLIENYLNYKQYDNIPKYLSQIYDAVKSLNEIVEQASKASNIFLGDITIQNSIRNLVDFCDQFIDRISEASNKERHFKRDFSSRIIILETDYDILEQILSQFINNAIKYTFDGGTIILKLEEGDKDITITVIDDGIGISEDEQQHLFDIFYRGNSVIGKYSGSGLGLSIAKNLADKINAQIQFESQEGVGSKFSLIIPKA
jgi:signal transduction histidine kinase